MSQRPVPILLILCGLSVLTHSAVSLYRDGVHQPVSFHVAPRAEPADLAAAPEALQAAGPKADAALQAIVDAAHEDTNLTPDTAAKLLAAAAQPYPHRSLGDAGTIREALSQLLMQHASAVPVPALRAQLADASQASPRPLALRILAAADTAEAAQALAAWLDASTRIEQQREVLDALQMRPHHPGVLLPAVLKLLEQRKLDADVEMTLICYGLANRLPRRLMAPHKATLLARYHEAMAGLRLHGQMDVPAPQRALGYREQMERASRLLGVFSMLPANWSATEVQEALAFPDVELALKGALALLNQGAAPTAELAARLAEDLTTRSEWLLGLFDADRLDLCPAPYKTDIARLESDLVEWLAYPERLGHPPAAIAFVREVELPNEEDGGKDRYFVYRFKSEAGITDGDDAPWLAGIAGPVLPLGELSHRVHTSSLFTPLADKTPERHVQELVERHTKAMRWNDG